MASRKTEAGLRIGWLLGMAAATLLVPGTARAWWNDDWTGRKQFAIDTAGAGITEPIGPAAVLVRLHTGNFRLEAARDDGSDLRFVAADDKTPLKFHLEKFDPLLGEALAWVAVPDLKPGARTPFYVYYGNAKALPAEDVKGTFDPGTALAYHFTEREQPARDSSGGGNQALQAGRAAEGTIIGRGLKLDGGAPLAIPAGPSLAWTAGGAMSWSIWLKPADAAASGVLFSRREGDAHLLVGLDAGRPYLEVSGPSGPLRVSASTAIPVHSWHHLAITAGRDLVIHVDGVPEGRAQAALPALSGGSYLGGEPAPGAALAARKGERPAPAAPAPFRGEVDELQIDRVERPLGWVRVAAIGQGSTPGKLVVAGPEEENSGWSSGYMGILLRSVTLDGWIVIGLLAVMAAVSWVVMAGKASYLSRVEKANERFLEHFRAAAGELARLVAADAHLSAADERQLRDSPLHRIYQGGAAEIRKRSDGTRALHAEAIEAIRATMDAHLVRENQRLNSQMVLLTIAISGGPFLGLLGTVVGVMITFASIALAGDVNVNAIAPGIAAALVATVAGLAVAIPALFGYNWLLTRAKNVTATMHVFADELVTKIAEAYSERIIAGQRGPHLATLE